MSDSDNHARSAYPTLISPSRDEWISGAGRTGTSADADVPSRDPLDKVVCRVGDGSCASAHAGVLKRSKRLDGARAAPSLLRLQRSYGNQYVGQVLSRASANCDAAPDMTAVERSIETARAGGHGLDHGTRAQMEGAFGADFSHVRIHTDSMADGLSHTLNARAFATGSDVFFRQGEYDPGSSSGRELLAHELTHVVQQTGTGIQRKLTVSQPDDPHETEADQMARAVIAQEHAQPAGSAALDRAEDEEKKEHPVIAKRALDAVQRQPEAPHPQDEEEKKKLHAKGDTATHGPWTDPAA